MANKYKDKLWCDLKTIEEKIEFLECGRAFETGIISAALAEDVSKLLRNLHERFKTL